MNNLGDWKACFLIPGLQRKLDEALEAKASVDELLETFHEKSEERDTNLKTIQAKLEQLSKAEIKANEYKDVLDQQQAELDQLKQKMQLKVRWFQNEFFFQHQKIDKFLP